MDEGTRLPLEGKDISKISEELKVVQEQLDRASFDASAEIEKTQEFTDAEDLEKAFVESVPTPERISEDTETPPPTEQDRTSVHPSDPIQPVTGPGRDPSEDYSDTMEGAAPGEVRGFSETDQDTSYTVTGDGVQTAGEVDDRIQSAENQTLDEVDAVQDAIPDLSAPGEDIVDDMSIEQMEALKEVVGATNDSSFNRIADPSVGEFQEETSVSSSAGSGADIKAVGSFSPAAAELPLEDDNGSTSPAEATETNEDPPIEDQDYSTVQEEFMNKLESYLDSLPEGDIMAILIQLFKESLEESNEDKSYWLEKIAEFNKIIEASGDYYDDLTSIESKQE